MPKKIPMRQCLGCREMKPKPELIRVVRSPDSHKNCFGIAWTHPASVDYRFIYACYTGCFACWSGTV